MTTNFIFFTFFFQIFLGAVFDVFYEKCVFFLKLKIKVTPLRWRSALFEETYIFITIIRAKTNPLSPLGLVPKITTLHRHYSFAPHPLKLVCPFSAFFFAKPFFLRASFFLRPSDLPGKVFDTLPLPGLTFLYLFL